MDKKIIDEMIKQGRKFMHHPDEMEDFVSDQMQKLPQPPLVKAPMTDNVMALPRNFEDLKLNDKFSDLLYLRKSHRVYTEETISLLELSFILYAIQGIKDIRGKNYATLRTVPSGGARHGFETYIIIKYSSDLKPGLYHYLPMNHELEFLKSIEDLNETMDASCERQTWATKASAIFYFTATPYRFEWRYGIHAHRPALIDLGHVGQNMYLATTALRLGTCGLASFDQSYCDAMLGIDGNEEFTVYVHPVGTIKVEDEAKEKAFYSFLDEE